MSMEDLLWFSIYCSSVVLRYVPPMYLFVPSIRRDLLTNLGLERTVLFTLGRRAGSSKSALMKPPLVYFCFRCILVAERLIPVACYFVDILFTELDLRSFGGPSTSGIKGTFILIEMSSSATEAYLGWLIILTFIVFSSVPWLPSSRFICFTICIRAKVFPKAWL